MRLLLRISRRAFWIVCRIFPIKENRIVFQTFYGRGYSDNPKYIAEKLRETGKDLDFIWVSNGREDPGVPEGFRVVQVYLRNVHRQNMGGQLPQGVLHKKEKSVLYADLARRFHP